MLAARGLVVQLLPLRIAKPKPRSIFVRNGVGTGIVLAARQPLVPPRTQSLPLFDPLKRWGVRRYVKKRDMPRISFFDRPRDPDPPVPSPDDLLEAGRLHRRLEAIASALDDLPRHARRLARWQLRRDAALTQNQSGDDLRAQNRGDTSAGGEPNQYPGQIRRHSPMRPGRPPGWRRRPSHDVHQVLNEVHGLAVWAMNPRDTS